MRKSSRAKMPPRETGVILISAGAGILCACFFPPRATIIILSALLALAGVCMIFKNGGGDC